MAVGPSGWGIVFATTRIWVVFQDPSLHDHVTLGKLFVSLEAQVSHPNNENNIDPYHCVVLSIKWNDTYKKRVVWNVVKE